jgi:hypothetical protein
MTLTAIAKQAEKFTTDHSPQILTGIAVAGTITTAYLTGKASIKAMQIIEEKNVEIYKSNDDLPALTPQDKVKLTWKLYVPPCIAGVTTVAAIIAANQIGTRRAAAMAAAAAISEKAFAEYKEKVVEKLGESKERAVRDEVAQDRVRNNPVTENHIHVAGGGKVLCYEPYTGRYFMSDMETLKKAQNDLNYMVLNHYYASQSDFYDLIGLDRTKVSDEVGWNSDKLLELTFSTVLSDDDRPCMVVDYQVAPIRGYSRVQ